VLRSQRDLIASYGRRLLRQGLVVGTFGNLSLRSGDLIAITPTSVPYDDIDAETVCVVDLDGKQHAGPHPPSIELPTHLALYRTRDDRAIIHSHAPFATRLASLVEAIPDIDPLLAELGGPVRTAAYARPGSLELAGVAVAAMRDRSAVLLRDHGTLTTGPSLASALSRTVTLETLAESYWSTLAPNKTKVTSLS
jgi:L-fuculose-phosphate aldolase